MFFHVNQSQEEIEATIEKYISNLIEADNFHFLEIVYSGLGQYAGEGHRVNTLLAYARAAERVKHRIPSWVGFICACKRAFPVKNLWERYF